MKNLLALVLLVFIAAGCSHSPQKNYVVLGAPEPSQTSTAITRTIGIGPVTIADYLKRQRMVYLNASNDLEVAENSYWAEPLDKGIARVLALNLVNAQPELGTVSFPWRGDNKPDLSLRVDVLGLRLNGDQASINADWVLFDNAQGKILLQQHFAASAKASGNAKSLARAYSQILAQFAQQMSKQISQQINPTMYKPEQIQDH